MQTMNLLSMEILQRQVIYKFQLNGELSKFSILKIFTDYLQLYNDHAVVRVFFELEDVIKSFDLNIDKQVVIADLKSTEL